MSSDQFITVTRTLVKRGWSDIEPKISVGLISGTFATAVVNFLIPITQAYGLRIPDSGWTAIPFIFAMLGGYIAPSAGTTVTKNETTQNGVTQQSETRSGNSVSVVTGPTPIQKPSAYDAILSKLPSATGPTDPAPPTVPEPDPAPADLPTQVMYR